MYQSLKILSFVGIIFLALFACKSLPNEQSAVKSVVAVDAQGNQIVYYKDKTGNETVYRKSCSSTDLSTPEKCPTTPAKAERPWDEYLRALLADGVTSVTANGIKEALESASAWDSKGSSDIIKSMDRAFAVDVASSQNPFTRVFVGTPASGAAAIPQESDVSLPLAKGIVLDELVDAKDWFQSSDKLYHGATHPAPGDAVVTAQVVNSCLSNGPNVPQWSDIVFHYYCQLGLVRGCFTGKVSGKAATYDHYKKSYDECLRDDASFKSYFAGNVAGIDYDRRRVVFQHIMFSVYAKGGTNLYDRDDQDEVINNFYDSTVTCQNRPNIPRSSADPLRRSSGQHCGDQQTPPPVLPPPGGGAVAQYFDSINGRSLYKVFVSGVMSDDNVFRACTAAGKKTPCRSGPGGTRNDTKCTDLGLHSKDNLDMMLSEKLCKQQPGKCPALDGSFVYMGNTWKGDACGIEGSIWCAAGRNFSNRNTYCTD